MWQHDHHECTCATSLMFTYGFFVRGTLLEVFLTRAASKVPIAVGAGEFDNPKQITSNKSLCVNVSDVTHLHS